MNDQYYRSKGKVRIIDGVYQPVRDSETERKLRRGNVRMDAIKQGVPPNFKYQRTSDGKRTLEMHIKCLSKVNYLKNGAVFETDDYVRTEKTLRGLTGKNITKKVKNEVCQYSDYEEASKVRKRIIAIQKMKTLDDQEFSFNIS